MRVLKALGKTILTFIGFIVGSIGLAFLMILIGNLLYEYWSYIIGFSFFAAIFVGTFIHYYKRTKP